MEQNFELGFAKNNAVEPKNGTLTMTMLLALKIGTIVVFVVMLLSLDFILTRRLSS